YFSHEVQSKSTYNLDYGNRCKSTFHTEWTTQGRYQEENGVYQLASNGTQGNIDFTLGNYCHPEYAIEFKHSQGWIHNPLVFDYMKLLDSANRIQKAISVAVIFRENDLSTQLTDKKVNETIEDLEERFKGQERSIEKGRPFLFWIIEVAPKAEKSEKIRSWYCNNLADGFQPMTELKDIWF
ncbi:MAG: hypothetical protein K2H70_00645, partial [Bacteroidales bacterium]|nr:hypothetical protein [Bacteroidales bacterium]